MSLLLFTDASGKALAVTGTPAPTDPWNNGLRYRNSDSALYVQQGFAPAGAHKLGGVARDDQGVMYLALDATPGTACYNNGGLLCDTTGTVYGTLNNPLSGYNGGNPVDSAGRILFAPAGFGGAPYVFVSSTDAYDSVLGGGTLSAPAIATPAGINVFVFTYSINSGSTMVVTDTAGNTYTSNSRALGIGPTVGQWHYKLNATANAANVITVTLSSGGVSQHIGIMVLQFTMAGAAFDVQDQATSNNTLAITSGTFSTTAAGLILAGRCCINSQTTWGFATGFTGVGPIDADQVNVNRCVSAYKITTGALASQTVTETGNVTSHRALCIACFK